MRISATAGLFIVLVATFAEANRECNNDSSGCYACVCNQWGDTAQCCGGWFNNNNGNCEGLRSGSASSFQNCCNGNGRGGFGRC
ncbi:hypothetical protein BG005_001459, partial [Podila minutissima]